MVGRAAERAAIDRLLTDQPGRGGALVLAGPAGIGKSALIRYAVEIASRFRVFRVDGVESETALAYAGVHQLVLPVLERVGELAEPQRVALDAALGGTSQQGAIEPYLVGLAVLNLLADAGRAQPVLVVIEDAHWLDAESVMALSLVGRRLRAEDVAIVITTSETGDAPLRFEGLPRVDLVGLPEPEARELLARAAGTLLDQTVATRILAATQGNPLALVELPAALTVEQLRGVQPLPDPLPIGERLSSLFAERLGVLDADTRMVLLVAAAERKGDPLLVRRAADAAGELSWVEAVAKAEASSLVTFTPTVEFRHPLVRSAVYYSAPPADRRRAHAALADALDAPADVDRRAWHLGAAAAGPDEQVARALEASASRARLRGGSSAAAVYLSRAAELTPERERAAERLLEAARAELTAGRGQQAQRILDHARANGLGAEHDADAAWTEALIHIVAGHVREPAALLADALGRIEVGDTELAVGACVAADAVSLAGAHLVDEPTRRAIAAGTLAVAHRCRIGDQLADLLSGVAARLIDEPATSTPILHAAVTSAAGDQVRLQTVAGRHVHVVYFDTTLAAADTFDDRAWDDLTSAWAQLARATGALAALPLALGFRGWLEVLQGRLGSAASHLAQVRARTASSPAPRRGCRGRRSCRHRGGDLLPERRRVRRRRRCTRPHGRRRSDGRAIHRSDVMMRPYIGSWKQLAVRGAAAVLFGLATLVWPEVTLWALVVMWGAFAFVDGVTALSAAITDRLLLHRGWVAFQGVTGITAGVVTLLWPSITAVALLVVIAAWSLLIGSTEIAFAIAARKQVSDAWSIALGGVLLVLLGVLLVISPGDGAIGITWAIGWFAFLFGTVQLRLAWLVRRETRAVASPTGARVSGDRHAVS